MTSKSKVHNKGTRMAGGMCQQAQQQLEDAISGVLRAEQQLRDNAREVRLELQSCVSRQQEALRCRELWLLSQVDLLEQLKGDALQQQLLTLHRLRGQFDIISHQMQSSSSKDLSNQLTSCMEKLSSLSLTPEETPEMSFHADVRSLRQAVTSFGRVSAQVLDGPSSQTRSSDGPQVSGGPGPVGSGSAAGGFQSSQNLQDWLLAQKEAKSSCPVLASMDFLQAWGQLRDLEAWLLKDQNRNQDQNQNRNQNQNRERTHSSCSSCFSIEKIDESDLAAPSEEEEEEEEEEEGGELGDWLLTPPAVAMETEAERRRLLAPFEAGWASSEWLAGRPVSVETAGGPVSMATAEGACSSCCQTGTGLEIENLGTLRCLLAPPTAPAPAVTPAPPAPPAVAPPTAPAPGALEAWLQQVAPLQQTCRANEACTAYSDCVCEQNCGREALSQWLLRREGRDKNGVPQHANAKGAPPPFLREQEQKVQAILEAWLHPTSSSPAPTSCSPAPTSCSPAPTSCSSAPPELTPFQRPLDPDLWVLPGPPRPAEEEEGEEDKWLLRKRSQAQERRAVCDLFSCLKLGGDKDQWLHRAAVQM